MPTGITLADALRLVAQQEREERRKLAEGTRLEDASGLGIAHNAMAVEMYVSGMYRSLALLFPVNARTDEERTRDLIHHVREGRHLTTGERVRPFNYEGLESPAERSA